MKHFKLLLAGMVLVGLLATSCAQHYRLASVERTRILVDSRYDVAPDARATQFMAPYKHAVDSIMSPVVGRAARYLEASRPESPLSNLLSDILVWGGKAFNEQPDLAIYNMGGIRAALAEGDITVGDVVDVAPFENKICFLTLKGSQLKELLAQTMKRGGEGVSHSVRIVATSKGELLQVTINGKEINPDADYRIATIDYLAQGNDGMTAFKYGTNVLSPQTEENNVRYIIMSYLREQMAQDKAVDATVEGRIRIEK